VEGSDGWQISKALDVGSSKVFNKPTFGSMELAEYVASLPGLEEVELVGLCTGLRHQQRPPAQGPAAGAAGHRRLLLLRLRHTAKPRHRAQRDEALPGQRQMNAAY
jgi:hypothetical protein